MPPKAGIRRPAAAPRVGRGLRRPVAPPGLLRIRRPREAEIADPPDLGAMAPRDWLGKGVRVFKGKYWDEEVTFAARVLGLETSDGESYLNLEVEGTTGEALLKFLSGVPSRQIYGHICGSECKALVWRNELCHISEMKEIEGDREAWTTNLKSSHSAAPLTDELAEVRREAALLAEGKELERGRKRDREEDLLERERGKRDRSLGCKKKKKRRRIKCRPKKDLNQMFGSTGLDPDPAVRKRLLRKAQRIAAKGSKKERLKSSSSNSSSSSTSSSGTRQGQSRDRLFVEDLRIHQVAEKYPGALAAGWLLALSGLPHDVAGAGMGRDHRQATSIGRPILPKPGPVKTQPRHV